MLLTSFAVCQVLLCGLNSSRQSAKDLTQILLHMGRPRAHCSGVRLKFDHLSFLLPR